MNPSQKIICKFLTKRNQWLPLEDIINQGKFKKSINFLTNMNDLIDGGYIQVKRLCIKGASIKCYKIKK